MKANPSSRVTVVEILTISDERLAKYISLNTLTKTLLYFKSVQDFDLQPHPGVRTLGSEVMMGMPTLPNNYDSNI